MPKKKFWQFVNVTNESAELLLYGDIADEQSWFGDEITPKEFSQELNALGNVSEIRVRINSGGGDVFAASAIGNLLGQNAATVTAYIDGLCASAATIVACHCDKVIAANDSIYMIHPVQIGIFGYEDAEELEKDLEALAAIRDNIISLYAAKTGRDKEDVAEQMDATAWLTAAEAKENGFVDELMDEEEDTVIEDRNGLLFVNSISSGIPFNRAPKFVQDSLAAAPAVEHFEDKNGANSTAPDHKEGRTMEIKTVDDLRREYPELVNEIETAAAEEATVAERQRIHDIEDMCLRGFEDLAEEAKFVNPVSADQYAIDAIKEQKHSEDAQKSTYLDNMKKGFDESGMSGVKSEPVDDTKPDEFKEAIKTVCKQSKED